MIETLHELLDLALHGGHLGAHIENDLDARQIHAQIARQMQNHFEPFQVFIGIEPRIAVAAAGLEQSFALIEAQRLGMHAILLGHRGDHVGGFGFLTHVDP